MSKKLRDPVLGEIEFDADLGKWKFQLLTIRHLTIFGLIEIEADWEYGFADPEDDGSIPVDYDSELERLRNIVTWVRKDEQSIRQYVAEDMFPDLQEENNKQKFDFSEVLVETTIECLKDYPSLGETVLVYECGVCFGGMVSIKVHPDNVVGEIEWGED